MRGKLLAAALFACVLAPSAAQAQTSFSSTGMWPDGGQWSSYSGARVYSEDNRDFRFQAFGCEWVVGRQITVERDYNYGRNLSAAEDFANVAIQYRAGMEEAGGQVDYQAYLIEGRTVDLPYQRPSNLSCDSKSALTFAFAKGIPMATITYLNGDEISRVAFRMRKNYFTPRGESEAWKFAGAIGLAIFRAWINGGNDAPR